VGCADVGAMCSGICGGALLVVSVGGVGACGGRGYRGKVEREMRGKYPFFVKILFQNVILIAILSGKHQKMPKNAPKTPTFHKKY